MKCYQCNALVFDKVAQRLMYLIRDEPITTKTLALLTGHSYAAILNSLKTLEQAGLIIRAKPNNRKYTYMRV